MPNTSSTASAQLTRAERSLTDLNDLFGLFDKQPPSWRAIAADSVPEPARSLLDHERHMTVTLETHHKTAVDLEVLDQRHQEPFYAREILLRDPNRDGHPIVQYGIMRFDLRRVESTVRALILEGDTPLGRILIEHQVLRRITMHGLLELHLDAELSRLLGHPADSELPVFGRLATILCNESPAVDLLEVIVGIE